ncbi:MAG: hypothetical protein ACTHM8_03085 [Sphingomonas sp.]
MNINFQAGATLQSTAIGYVLQALAASCTYDLEHVPGLPDHALPVIDRGCVLAVTSLPAPLFRPGVRAAAAKLQYDVALLRIDDDMDTVHADVTLGLMPGEPFVLDNMALYDAEDGNLWFVPPTFGPAVSISADGLILELLTPYESMDQRDAGVARVREAIQQLFAPAEVC